MTPAKSPPPVTIGLPVCNGEEFLSKALDSLKSQTFTDFEVVVADNASTDATADIVRQYSGSDPRFIYHRNPENIGGARNSNLLLHMARSPLFQWVYYDDLLSTDHLERAVAAFDSYGSPLVAVVPRIVLINELGVRVGEYDDGGVDLMVDSPNERLHIVFKQTFVNIQFALMRTHVLRAAGGAPVHVAGEYVLPTAMALRGKLWVMPEPTLSIRVHTARFGGDRKSEMAWADPHRTRMAFPYSRSSWLQLQAVRAAGLPRSEERRCIRRVLRDWTLPRWRTPIGDLIRLPRDLGFRE